ncbi:13030_t:CDS:2 [Racocetra persica]|uniref:13030_t:CDS:1 n=1 Tax=Racocetra persica TaxID=160502 RepID=A0ACA9MQ88_9GLOM|nr:13030_t:CDS:2 [Racocetra persica]
MAIGGYPIPNGYIVSVTVYGINLIAKTQYNSYEEVLYTITWDNGTKQSVSSNKSAKLDVNELHINFQNLKSEKSQSNQFLDSIVCHEYKIERHRQEITKIMDNKIPIHMAQKSPVLQLGDVIHIKLSGDKRQVGKHHNHVMVTMCILNKHNMVLNPFNQYCIFLYDETEQYESLQIVFSFLICELTTLNVDGIIDSNNNHWKIEFWFGSDWKFMSLILGTKGPTANYFYLYCDCKNTDRWDINKDYENLYNTQE